MMADCFTKPLQGALFRKLRDAIMNIIPHEDGPGRMLADPQVHGSVLKNEVRPKGDKLMWLVKG